MKQDQQNKNTYVQFTSSSSTHKHQPQWSLQPPCRNSCRSWVEPPILRSNLWEELDSGPELNLYLDRSQARTRTVPSGGEKMHAVGISQLVVKRTAKEKRMGVCPAGVWGAFEEHQWPCLFLLHGVELEVWVSDMQPVTSLFSIHFLVLIAQYFLRFMEREREREGEDKTEVDSRCLKELEMTKEWTPAKKKLTWLKRKSRGLVWAWTHSCLRDGDDSMPPHHDPSARLQKIWGLFSSVTNAVLNLRG